MSNKNDIKVEEVIKCFGHPNITSDHESTFEITKDKEIGKSADCIICTSANKGAKDLSKEFKKHASNKNSKIVARFILKGEHDGNEVVVKGEGHPDLSYDHETDLVGRTSNYTCTRTLMVNANFSSADFPESFIKKMKDPKSELNVILEIY